MEKVVRVSPQAIDTYARAIVSGKTQYEAYSMSHPRSTSTGANLRVTANRFNNRPDVQARIAELRKSETERWSGFRDELIGMLAEEIRTCYQDNHTLSPVMKQVDSITKILGMDKQTIEVKADVRQAIDQESVGEKINFLIVQAKGANHDD